MAAKRDYIDRMADKLYTKMKGDVLDSGMDQKRSADRVGVFQDLLIEAVRDSTICCFNGLPHYFDGRVYAPMGRTWDAFYSLIRRVADRCALQPGDKTRLENVKKVLRAEVALKTLDVDNSVIVFRNGVLDVERGTFHDFHRRFRQVTQMDFDYDPDAYPNVWIDYFLSRVLPDEGCQMILQEFMGAIFIDRTKVKLEKMLILLGSGSNGKSVVFETLRGLLGEDNVKTLAISDLIGGSDRKQNIASINGRRLNYCSEIQTEEFGRNVDRLKALVSGEPVEVRLVFANNFTARNIPLLMANANRMPYIRDWTHGLSRRIMILPFDVIISEREQNKSLSNELRKEYSGILNWILQGRSRLIANNYQFSMSQKLQDTVDEYQSESSTVLQFMRAKDYNRTLLEVNIEPRSISARTLFNAYSKWCIEKGIEAETETKFGLVLKEAGFEKRKEEPGMVYRVYSTRFRNPDPAYRGKNKDGSIRGMRELANWAQIPYAMVQKMMLKGVLDGTYVKEGRTTRFNASEAKRVMREYIRSKKRRAEVDRVPLEVRNECRKFNERMKLLGEPYRKYSTRQSVEDGLILVAMDWDYDLEMGSEKKTKRLPEYKRDHKKEKRNRLKREKENEKEKQD